MKNLKLKDVANYDFYILEAEYGIHNLPLSRNNPMLKTIKRKIQSHLERCKVNHPDAWKTLGELTHAIGIIDNYLAGVYTKANRADRW